MESYRISIIAICFGCDDDRSVKIVPDVFGTHALSAGIRFCIVIVSMFVLAVAFCFHLFKERINIAFQFITQRSAESVTRIVVVKVLYMTPEVDIIASANEKATVNVRIPF